MNINIGTEDNTIKLTQEQVFLYQNKYDDKKKVHIYPNGLKN